MNTRDEILEALSGNCGDYAPPAVFTQSATTEQMEACGCSWPLSNSDPASMARLSAQLHRQFGFATAKVPFDLVSECEAAGCSTDPGSCSRQPSVTGSPYRCEGVPDVPDLPDADVFSGSGRLPAIREAASLLEKDGDLFVIGGCIDPVNLSMQCMGAENFLLGTMLEPERTKAWISATLPLLAHHLELLSENADCVQIVALATSDMVDPKDFGTYIGEPVGKMIRSARSMVTIHSCGNTLPVLTRLASLGEDGLSVETDSGPERILEEIGGRTTLIGGIPPISVLMQGTPEDVARNAEAASELGYAIIAPECGVPPVTPGRNLSALANYRF